jgi:uncharacterized protein (TIRG00374 family)
MLRLMRKEVPSAGGRKGCPKKSEARGNQMKRGVYKILFQWGLALLLIFLLFYFGDVSNLVRLPEIHWNAVFLLFLCNAAFSLAHNFRWKLIVDHISGEKKESFFSLYRYLLNSYALGLVVPLDVSLVGVRTYHLSQSKQLQTSLAIFSALLDRFLDVILFLIMALPSFLFITKAVSAPLAMLVVLLLLVGLSLLIRWKKGETFAFLLKGYRSGFVGIFSRVPFFRKWIAPKGEVAEMACQFDQSSVSQIMSWNVIKYIFLTFRFYLTGQALGVHFSPVQGFFFIPFIQLSGFVNFTPGGLGVVEAGTYGALLLMGIPKSQILLFVVGRRVLLFPMFLILFGFTHFSHFIQSRWRRLAGVGWK